MLRSQNDLKVFKKP